MIPKVIHYCWFGKKPLPELALKCIASWKKFLPDYEIKEWNESNFNINQTPYTKQAYKCKKYAFVSDYARFKILFEHGGIYFDTDVEIIKPLDHILSFGPFMACERDFDDTREINTILKKGIAVAPGLGLASEPGHPIYKELMNLYQHEQFKLGKTINLTTVVIYTTALLIQHGLQNIPGIQVIEGIAIYPKSYFCPLSTDRSSLRIETETVTIHHYAASWIVPQKSLVSKIWLFFHLPKTDFRKKFCSAIKNFVKK